MKTIFLALTSLFFSASAVLAATLTFGATAPTPAGSAAISNWIGAAYDANNIGGNGVNVNGGANNGGANDATTYVSNNRAAQGETFTTGSNAGGYTLTAITVRATGYTNNTASGTNDTYWTLANTGSTFYVRVGQLSGTTFIPYTIEYAASGGTGNPGTSNSANGSGVYLTFTLKAPIVLQPNTVYAFDLGTSSDYFEMLGISTTANGGTTPYAGGVAYTSGANGVAAGSITTQAGNRVFMVDMAPYTPPAPGAFVHPGLLNTAADFVRMRNNVALGVQPWASAYAALTASWMGDNPNWTPRAQATITRSSTTNNTSLLYNDIAVAYGCALRWKVSGDTAYADEAVRILNAWGYTFTSIAGDSNVQLCNLYGYQFACVAEVMRTYSGWAPADVAQFQSMMYNVFYGEASDFLNRHNGTDYSHYWANWDLCGMADIYAIGVLNDNSTLTNQALTYFYSGLGEGCIDRTVNYIHPGLSGQGQEIGRDQGHASLDIAELAPLCQMAWNQGVDLYGYENNRMLSMAEYTAKYNLFNPVPFATYYSTTGGLMTGPSSDSQGSTGRPGWATIYNHYVNIKGLAAPYTQTIVNQNGANWSFNGDEPGWDYLTASLPSIATGANPSGLTAIVTAQQPVLSWWGSAYATGYNVLRSTTNGGPYTTIASGLTTNTYTDTSASPGTTYYYVVNGALTSGTTGNSNQATAIISTALYAELKFDDGSGTTASDSTGDGWTGTLVNGATWTTGQTGGAVNLASASSQYVSLPTGVTSDLSDFTISAWVKLSSISTWARIFDMGYVSFTSTNERYMDLAASNGSVPRFAITHSGGGGEEWITSNIALPTNQWVHVAVTMSGPIGTLYINGNAVGQNRNMYTTPNRLPGGINYAYIGKSGYSSDPYLNGAVDDFRIYHGPLSVGQVYTLATGLQPATPPAAPTNLSVTAQPAQDSLSWTASSGATSYTILRATSANGPFSILATIVPGTTYVDTNITAGTTYYYEVDGANSGGDGATTASSSGVVALPPLPSTPTGLYAYAASKSSTCLNWTAAANAYTYTIGRSLTNGGPYTTVATGVTATTYVDTGLTTGTAYYYVINSVNTAGTSANSSQVSATPADLLMHLPFDATSGSIAADTSGNGWNATLNNSPSWTSGIFGNALNFASASSQYGTIPNGFLSQVNDFTISVWVNPTTLTEWARVFDCGTGTTNYMLLTIQGPAGTGKPRFAIATPSVTEQDLDSSIAIPTGTWSQITITHTGTTGCMYINGTLAATNTSMTLVPSSLGVTTNNYIGQSEWTSDPHLNATLDDLRLYDYAMTSTQAAAAASPAPTTPTGLIASAGDGQAILNWNVSDSATTYTVKRATTSGGPYTTVASGLSVPNYTNSGLTDGTTYYYVVDSVNWLGTSANSNEAATVPYPISWTAQDVGTVAAAGSSSMSSGTFTVNGSGADIWGTADACQFYSTPVTGDCVITARVVSVQDVNAWSKAGVMIRGSTAANATNATVLVTPTTTNGIQWQNRVTNGGSTSGTDFSGITAPHWVRLARQGTTVTGYMSPDGASWTSTGSATLSSLGSTAYVGLAVTSHTDGTLCTATFDNVSVYWIPSAPTATATPGAEQVSLSWSGVSGANSYNVKRSPTSGGPYTTIASGVTTTGYTDTGLTDGTTYYYVASAVNLAGEGANSAETSAAPNGLPAQVTNVVVTPNSDQGSITWSAAVYATSYAVGRSTTSGGPYTTIASGLTSTGYVDTGVTDGTTYYYVVTASDAVGAGASSSASSSTPVSQNLYWDTTTAAGLGNGSGNWDINTTNIWSNSSAGTSNPLLPWLSDDGAFFQSGGAMTATISPGTTIKLMSLNQAVNGTAATVAGGTLQIDSNTGITNAIGGGNSALTINSAVVLNSGTVTFDNETTAGAITVNGAITETGGSRSIVKTGAGVLVLTGSNTYSGATTISAGTLQFNSATSMSTGSGISLGSNATLSLSPSSSATFTPASLTGMNGGGTYNFVVNSTSSAQTITLATGPVGSGSTSNTAINVSSSTTGDTLKFGNAFQVASSSGSANGGPSANFNLTNANLILTGLSNSADNGDGGIAVASTTSNTLTLNGTVSTNTNRTLYATVNSGGLILNNTVSGGGTNWGFFVTLNGGILDLNNTAVIAASHIPGLTLAGGTVDNTSGAAVTESNNPSVGINGSFTFGTATDTSANSLNLGTGAVTLNVATSTITAAGSGTLTLGGAIGDGGNARGIIKAGSGNLALNGVSTYTGATTVNAGTLLVNGSLAAGSTVTVNSGATLGGTGTVKGTLNLASGGTLVPGNGSTTGTLTCVSGLSLSSGANLNFSLGSTSSSDKIAVTSGYVAPGSGTVTLNISALTGFGVGTYNLITGATGISASSFTLNAPSGYTYTLGAGSGTLSLGVSGPGSPTGLAVDGFSGSNNLNWTASSGATSYAILRSTNGGSYVTLASGISGTNYNDLAAVSGTAYSYEVTASNLGGTSAASAASGVTTATPVAYLKFDEGTGTTTADATGNGWTGTLVNTPAWVAGRNVNGIGLNGTNQYVSLPSGVVGTLTNCTIAMWANLDAAPNWSRLFDFGTGTSVNMFLTPNNGSTLRFAITTSGSGHEQRIDGTATFPIGGWHHVAVTLAGAVGTLYVDGIQVGQNTAMTLNPSSLGSTNLNYIGHSQYSADPYLNGVIDEFRIYSSALTSSQITSLMANSPPGLQYPATSLVATAGSKQVALTWTAAAGATGYEVLRATVSGGPYTTVATGVTTTGYTDTGLTTGTTYYYAVMAYSATSESPNSNQASATSQ